VHSAWRVAEVLVDRVTPPTSLAAVADRSKSIALLALQRPLTLGVIVAVTLARQTRLLACAAPRAQILHNCRVDTVVIASHVTSATKGTTSDTLMLVALEARQCAFAVGVAVAVALAFAARLSSCAARASLVYKSPFVVASRHGSVHCVLHSVLPSDEGAALMVQTEDRLGAVCPADNWHAFCAFGAFPFAADIGHVGDLW